MSTSTTSAEAYRLPRQRGDRIRLPRHPLSPDPNEREAVRSWLKSQPRPWAIDPFSGAGGLSLGLEEAGFSVVTAADSDPVAMETHAANIPGLTWVGDLSNPDDFLSQLEALGIDEVDLLAGGPPLPAVLARRNDRDQTSGEGGRSSIPRREGRPVEELLRGHGLFEARGSSLQERSGFHPRGGLSIADRPRKCTEGSWVRSPHRRFGRLEVRRTPAPVTPLLGGHPKGRDLRIAIREFISHTVAGHQRPSNRRGRY